MYLVLVRLHSIISNSRANGPGIRTVIWFQGCTLLCSNCFNPQTHSSSPALVVDVPDLVEMLRRDSQGLEGITISGGEPLQQGAALLQLLRGVRGATDLSIILFSGYTLAEIEKMPFGCAILAQVDVLIDGRYVHDQRIARDLRGSANQKLHLFTKRYTLAELEATVRCEIQIDPRGEIVITGINPVYTGQTQGARPPCLFDSPISQPRISKSKRLPNEG